jgi:hypothetical protein
MSAMNMVKFKKTVYLFSVFLFITLLNNGDAFSSVKGFNLVSLLGKSVRNTYVKKFMSSFDEKPQINNFENLNGGIYYCFRKNGIEILFKNNRVDKIFLHSEGYDGYKQYEGAIPYGINFSYDKSKTHKKLGPPSKSGGERKLPDILKDIRGKIPRWDKWVFARYTLCIQYYDDGQIAMITLSRNTKK